jgi:hypothetical protein
VSAQSARNGQREVYGRILERFAYLVLAAIFVLYVALDLSLYADGSLFAFALATGEPWSTFWANLPTRVTSFLVTGGLPYLVAEATGSFRWTLWTYSAAVAAVPVMGLLATRALDPWRGLLTSCCACSTVAVVLFVVFFPTEIWVTHAMFWPTLGYAISGRGRSYPFILPVLLAAFALTHEAALILLPMLMFIAAAHRSGGKQIAVMIMAFVVALAAWASVKTLLPIPHEATRLAVENNGLRLFNPGYLFNNLSLSIAISLLCFSLIERAIKVKSRLTDALALLSALALVIACLLVLPDAVHRDETRYSSRLIVFLFLVSFSLILSFLSLRRFEGLCAVLKLGWLARSSAWLFAWLQGREPALWRSILALALIAGTAHLFEAAMFAQRWSLLQNGIEMAGKEGPGPGGDQYGLPPGAVRLRPAQAQAGPQWRLAWDWALPFHALAVSELRGGRYLIYSDTQHAQYLPLQCRQMADLEGRPAAISAHRLSLLRRYICTKERSARGTAPFLAPGDAAR